MFNHITFLRSEKNQRGHFNLGLLAETLLFYKNTNFLIDGNTLISLLRMVGPTATQRLITSTAVTPILELDTFGVNTETNNGLSLNNFCAFQLAGTEKGGLFSSNSDRIQILFQRALGNSHGVRKSAFDFLNHVKVHKDFKGRDSAGGPISTAYLDLDNAELINESVDLTLKHLLPKISLGRNWHFKIHKLENGFVVDTNLDFNYLNAEYQKNSPTDDATISPAYLLTSLFEANVGLHYSSNYESDIITDNFSSQAMRLKVSNAMQKRNSDVSQIDLFQTATMGKGTAIREALNSGERTFDEFLDLLEHANQFKTWLGDKDPEASLIQDYYSEMTAGTWADKLPAKSFRWVFFTGAGLLLDFAIPTGFGTATGVALSAGDAFLLDRVAKGWRPNQFVEGPLTEFSI